MSQAVCISITYRRRRLFSHAENAHHEIVSNDQMTGWNADVYSFPEITNELEVFSIHQTL